MTEQLPPIHAVACKMCGHAWYPRRPDERPHMCPNCRSLRWAEGPRKPREQPVAVA